jgi:hypothetical protein
MTEVREWKPLWKGSVIAVYCSLRVYGHQETSWPLKALKDFFIALLTGLSVLVEVGKVAK